MNLVYSAVPKEPPCPKCGQSPCACPKAEKPPLKQKDPVVVKIDRSGRKGKTVTLVSGLQMHPEGKETLLRRFKNLCGAGGTLKEGSLEIQGDHRPRLKAELESLGYRVRVL